MHPPIVVLLVAWITLVIGDASHVQREDLFNRNTNLSDSHIRQQLSRLNLSIYDIPGLQSASTADVVQPALGKGHLQRKENGRADVVL